MPVLNVQHGFRRANGTAAATFITKRVLEEARRTGLPLVCTFVDLTKAYDSVPRDLIWETMRLYGFGENTIAIVRALYRDDVAVKLDGRLSDTHFATARGVRQGCLLSPLLFNLVLDRVLRTALPAIEGIPFVNGSEHRAIKARAYADDIALFSRNLEHAQRDIIALNTAFAAAGLQLNKKKTVYTCCEDRRQTPAALAAEQLTREQLRTAGVMSDDDPTLVNSGALWFVPPADQWARKRIQCPLCPPTTPPYRGDNCLRDHFEVSHNLVVSVSQLPPVKITIAPVVARPDGSFACPSCDRGPWSRRNVAEKHWRDTHLAGEDDVVRNARATTLRGAKSNVTLPYRCTAAERYADALHAAGLDFSPVVRVPLPRTAAPAPARPRAPRRQVRPAPNVDRQQPQQQQPQPPGDTRRRRPRPPRRPGDGQRPDATAAAQQQQQQLRLGDHVFQRVEQFRYLGRVITDNNSDGVTISERIRIADATFQQIRKRLRRGDMASRKTSLRLYDAVVGAQLLFGAETWTPTEHDQRRLERFHERNLRHITGLLPTWTGPQQTGHIVYPPTHAVLRAANRPPMTASIEDAAVRFYGHILRRPTDDDLRFVADARIATLRARQDISVTTIVDRMRATAHAAGLAPEDAVTRACWRAKRVRLLQQRAQLAHEPTAATQPQAGMAGNG